MLGATYPRQLSDMPRVDTHPLRSIAVAISVLLVAMASYQCGAAIAKHLFPAVGAEGATAYRLGLGALILLMLRRPWRSRSTKQNRRALWAYGLSLGAMNLMFYMALQRIPLGLAVALEFTGPLAIALFHSRRWLDIVWIVLVGMALVTLLPLGHTAQRLDPAGVAYAFCAGVGWALYILFGQKAGAAYGNDAAAWGTSIAALLALPIGVAHAGHALLSLSLLWPALGLAVLSSALPYSLEMIALTRLTARTFGVLLSLEPALAALAGMLFLGEHLTSRQWFAIVAIIIASAGTVISVRQVAAEPRIP